MGVKNYIPTQHQDLINMKIFQDQNKA